MNILAITQARIGSSRLPAKVLKDIGGITLLELHLRRLMQSRLINKIVVATTLEEGVEAICNIATALELTFYQGSVNDVLDRYYQAATPFKPDYVVRITADCPLLDATVVDEVIQTAINSKADYVSNGLEQTFPDGLDVEVFTFAALEKAWNEAHLLSDREHVTPYIWRNSSFKGGNIFTSKNVFCNKSLGGFRLTVDEPADLEVIRELVERLGSDRPWMEYIDLLEATPEIRKINGAIERNEGYKKSLDKD